MMGRICIFMEVAHSISAEVLAEFRRGLRGNLRMDPVELGIYATDASMYQMVPLAVIEPVDRDDAVEAVRICSAHGLSILPRGGGTSLTGQTVNRAVVIDLSRYCNQVLEFHVAERWVRVQPGLVRDELNAILAPHGLHFAPDPATSNRANIGGMIGSNAAGMRSLRYGMTIDHVREVVVALSSGEVVTLGEVGEDAIRSQDVRGRLLRGLRGIVEANREQIRAGFPRVGRRSGGYALDAYPEAMPWNLSRIVSGSEGTLGLILEATLNLEPLPHHSGLCLAQFTDLADCLRAVESIVSEGASSVELLDGLIIRQAREHPMTRATCRRIQGDPEGVLIVEVQEDDPDEVQRRLERIQSVLRRRNTAYLLSLVKEPEAMAEIWLMRSSALGLITTVKGDRKPSPYIEDAAVPLDVLPAYVERVLAICRKHDQPVSVFAHAGAGLLHIRPLHDLHQASDVEQLKQIQQEVFDEVVKVGGSWSGEHGDGIVRGGFNQRFFGDELYRAFEQVKALFDPLGLMNPGKIIHTPSVDGNLRFGGEYRLNELPTRYRFSEEDGLRRAVELCTGVGACRKTLNGVMCPSYMATRDEAHSTRGRANALRLALSGQLGPDAISGENLHGLFDLCLACKGCKGECPNKVDVGKMKGELLCRYYQEHRRPLRSRMFSNPGLPGRMLAGRGAPAVNALLGSRVVRAALDATLGIDPRRPLPRYANRRFSSWYRAHRLRHPLPAGVPTVLLFNDIYTEFHEPETGHAVVRVLEAAGWAVVLSPPMDSQRPALSQGHLELAKRRGTELFNRLDALSADERPILVIEPSCESALVQDLPDLIDDSACVERVTRRVMGIETFLLEAVAAQPNILSWRTDYGEPDILFHGHCHQKAMGATPTALALLRKIPGARVQDSGAGCCGMAGGFGYETDHYALSVQVAGHRLLPAIARSMESTWLVANGFSCRHQISDLTRRPAQHPVQAIDRCIQYPPGGSST